jgi:excisionase family DNA binding protein
MTEKMYTTTEVGLIFRVAPKHALFWCHEKIIAAVKTPGGHWRVPKSAVQRFLPPDLDPDALLVGHTNFLPSSRDPRYRAAVNAYCYEVTVEQMGVPDDGAE